MATAQFRDNLILAFSPQQPFYRRNQLRRNPRHFHPLTVRTMMEDHQQSYTSNQYGSISAPTSASSSFSIENNVGPHSALDAPSSFFDESFFPDAADNASENNSQLPQWPVVAQARANEYYPFRPLDMNVSHAHQSTSSLPPSSATFDNTPTFGMAAGTPAGFIAPQKVEHSPSIVQHPVLHQEVDASQYEIVDNNDWAYSSTEAREDASSPESMDAHSPGPQTPTSIAGPGNGFLRSFFGDGYVNHPQYLDSTIKVDSNPLRGASLASTNSSSSIDQTAHTFPLGASFGGMTVGAFGGMTVGAFGGMTVGAFGGSATMPSAMGLYGSFNQVHGLPGTGFTWLANYSHLLPPQIPTQVALPELQAPGWETTPEASDTSEEDDFEPSVSNQAVTEAHQRRDRDEYLLRMRKKGYSYKDIKRLGKFREAESTLRGRVRVLTKDKSERLRSPSWTPRDVALLRRAVQEYSDSPGASSGRMPWQKIAEWIYDNGGSYRFAAATCARKWRE